MKIDKVLTKHSNIGSFLVQRNFCEINEAFGAKNDPIFPDTHFTRWNKYLIVFFIRQKFFPSLRHITANFQAKASSLCFVD